MAPLSFLLGIDWALRAPIVVGRRRVVRLALRLVTVMCEDHFEPVPSTISASHALALRLRSSGSWCPWWFVRRHGHLCEARQRHWIVSLIAGQAPACWR